MGVKLDKEHENRVDNEWIDQESRVLAVLVIKRQKRQLLFEKRCTMNECLYVFNYRYRNC